MRISNDVVRASSIAAITGSQNDKESLLEILSAQATISAQLDSHSSVILNTLGCKNALEAVRVADRVIGDELFLNPPQSFICGDGTRSIQGAFNRGVFILAKIAKKNAYFIDLVEKSFFICPSPNVF